VAIITITVNRSHVEALNGFVSMRTSIVVRHRNVDGVHRIALGVSAIWLARPSRKKGVGVYADADEASVALPISALPESWAGVFPYVSRASG
jgi:hypothetical protein